MFKKTENVLIFNLVCAISLFCSIYKANANGAAYFPGYTGTDITVAESKPFEEFIVDEEVVININKSYISIVYDITNTSSAIKSFNMLFPIESRACELGNEVRFGDKSWEELTVFKANLNDIILSIKFFESSEIKLEGEYNKFGGICSIASFPVEIKPGQNKLNINFHVEPTAADGPGLGAMWYLIYPVWPAKNWVTKFRKAIWRVVIPDYIILSRGGYHKYQFDDWYLYTDEHQVTANEKEISFVDWRKKGWSVKGPGIRKDYQDHVDFIAMDYKPAGEVSVELTMYDLPNLIMTDCNKSGNYPPLDMGLCMESYFKIHPYIGDKRCYFAADLACVVGDMDLRYGPETMSFFRNEIYARKGYIFTSEPMKKFFSKMPWYQPKFKEVKLTDIEMWNVEYIKEIEKKVHTIEDYNKNPYILSEIRRQMRKTP